MHAADQAMKQLEKTTEWDGGRFALLVDTCTVRRLDDAEAGELAAMFAARPVAAACAWARLCTGTSETGAWRQRLCNLGWNGREWKPARERKESDKQRAHGRAYEAMSSASASWFWDDDEGATEQKQAERDALARELGWS